MKKKTIHTLVTPSGDTYEGTIEWTGTPDPHKWRGPIPDDYISYLFLIDGAKVWLSNYNARLKCGKGGKWWWDCNEAAEKKIKKGQCRPIQTPTQIYDNGK